ncbi:MAG: hypothetical protein HY042_00910 [Spirochaetia bacterium]|nr:hypothetical protein [Spirochaetia bacterium]
MKVDRRHVSHILHERRDGRNYLTLLVSYPFPWSYKAASHPVRRECGDAGECAALLRQIDAHLVQGFEIELVIENGEISAMTFLTQ